MIIPASLLSNKKHNYFDDVSIPGIGKARESTAFRRIFWISLFVLGMALTIFQVQDVLEDYAKYPIKTNVGKKNKE